MKQLLVFLLLPFYVYSQQWTGNSDTYGTIQHEGIVNIGSVGTPQAPGIGIMSIGSAYVQGMWGTGYIGFNLRRRDRFSGLWDYNTDGIDPQVPPNMGASIIYGTQNGGIHFATRGKPRLPPFQNGSLTSQQVADLVKLRIEPSGQVAIGNGSMTLPGTYKLYVQGGILTEEVKVATYGSNAWADYVFEKTYRLPNLEYVKTYTEKNFHLPNFPSTQQIIDNGGINLKEITIKQQEEIEKLYLYIFKITEQIKELEQEIKLLKSK